LVNGDLEQELKEVVRERGDIAIDRFDELIEGATVLDLADSMEFEACCDVISEALAEPLDLPTSVLRTGLIDREKEASTVLNPFLLGVCVNLRCTEPRMSAGVRPLGGMGGRVN